MNYQHKELAAGRWRQLSFVQQMANVGSEVERSLNWRAKNNADYSQKAFERALELIDLTLEDPRNINRLKEIARLREALADFFVGSNEFSSTDTSWRRYFLFFAFAARKDC
ncbi:hypothetical protein HZA56_15370 [Candidatus Poribacteria bacterium]|nr:hypothetical protein [Candidatus Poribacteria bacterium]